MFLQMIIHPGLADFREKHLVRCGIANTVGDKLPSMLWYFRMSVLFISARLLTTGYFASNHSKVVCYRHIMTVLVIRYKFEPILLGW